MEKSINMDLYKAANKAIEAVYNEIPEHFRTVNVIKQILELAKELSENKQLK